MQFIISKDCPQAAKFTTLSIRFSIDRVVAINSPWSPACLDSASAMHGNNESYIIVGVLSYKAAIVLSSMGQIIDYIYSLWSDSSPINLVLSSVINILIPPSLDSSPGHNRLRRFAGKRARESRPSLITNGVVHEKHRAR